MSSFAKPTEFLWGVAFIALVLFGTSRLLLALMPTSVSWFGFSGSSPGRALAICCASYAMALVETRVQAGKWVWFLQGMDD